LLAALILVGTAWVGVSVSRAADYDADYATDSQKTAIADQAVESEAAPGADTSIDQPAAPLDSSEAGPAPESKSEKSPVLETKAVRPSPAPPIGVRSSTALEAGQMRLAYSFEHIRFREILVGGRDRTPSEVLNGFYQQAPTELDITVHEFELAYAPHSRVTLVVSLPFIQKELQRLSIAAGRSEEQTEGIGDLQFSVIVPFIRRGRESSQIHLGIKAPTGSIRRGGDRTRLPYDLQIGNGTWDLEWGWTYRGERDLFSWGGQFWGAHPVGTNGLKYREGSRFNASIWSAVKIVGGLSASVRLGAEKRNNIRGFDRSLDLAADGPSSNDKARGGFRVDIIPGLSLEIPELNHQKLSVEFGIPVHQDLDGPQLSRDWSLKGGWQWVF